MIHIREAQPEDLTACVALKPTYTTRMVCQITQEGGPLLRYDTPDKIGSLLSFHLQQVRLPRKQVIKLPSSVVSLERVWEGVGARFVAMRDDEHLCGYVLLHILPDQQQAWVARLLVEEAERGKGAGTKLLRTARTWALEQELSSLVAHVPLRNVPGMTFYERRGFRICGLSKLFYPTREDALLLEIGV